MVHRECHRPCVDDLDRADGADAPTAPTQTGGIPV
jgi:hypothetical protein